MKMESFIAAFEQHFTIECVSSLESKGTYIMLFDTFEGYTIDVRINAKDKEILMIMFEDYLDDEEHFECYTIDAIEVENFVKHYMEEYQYE